MKWPLLSKIGHPHDGCPCSYYYGEGKMGTSRQMDDILSFNPNKSPIPELRDWAEKNCKDR
jgi:hypothetical protein